MERIYSPSTREMLTIVDDEHPPIEEQFDWIEAHPDAVRLLNEGAD